MAPAILYPLEREYPVTSPFGYRVDPLGRVIGNSFHGGVDLGAPTGTPLYAVASGRISMGWDIYGGGNWSGLAAADGSYYGYGHQSVFVRDPDGWVEAGQLIGYVGSTGASTGAHLHFAYKPAGSSSYADGLPLLQAALAAGRFPGRPAPSPDPETEDWFDMATKDELRDVVRDVVQTEFSNADARLKAFLIAADAEDDRLDLAALQQEFVNQDTRWGPVFKKLLDAKG